MMAGLREPEDSRELSMVHDHIRFLHSSISTVVSSLIYTLSASLILGVQISVGMMPLKYTHVNHNSVCHCCTWCLNHTIKRGGAKTHSLYAYFLLSASFLTAQS